MLEDLNTLFEVINVAFMSFARREHEFAETLFDDSVNSVISTLINGHFVALFITTDVFVHLHHSIEVLLGLAIVVLGAVSSVHGFLVAKDIELRFDFVT